MNVRSEHNRPPYLKAALENPSFSSEDIASILFANEDKLGFGDRLSRAKHLRVLLYLHFGALVYHVGQLMALGDHAMPRFLCFTGRGSLYVRLLSAGPNMKSIENLSRAILKQVSGQEPPANFKIILAEDPKQTTANGGVLAGGHTGLTEEGLDGPNLIIRPIGTGKKDAQEIAQLLPSQVTEQVKASVLNNVRNCLRILLQDPVVASQQENLGIQNIPGQVLQFMESELADSFNMCLEQYASTLPDGQPIPESLFFLPFKNSLYQLSKELYQQAASPITSGI